MGCAFCATGTLPIVADLSACEIVEQLLHAQALEAAAGRPAVKNAVFMGMGEPLNNYDEVLTALRLMTDASRLGPLALSPARVIISTVGVVHRMRRLATDAPTVGLALSLHAPTQALREEIVPAAKHHPLPELMQALDDHVAECKQRSATSPVGAMVEYVLLDGVNDSDTCATELGQLMAPRAQDVMVNLIPYNPGPANAPRTFTQPPHERVERFQQIVAAYGVTTRVRREMGRDIAGACGQLALTREAAQTPEQQRQIDFEDFVDWRRKQPQATKDAVNAEALAVAAAARAAAEATCAQAAAPLSPTPQLAQYLALDIATPWATAWRSATLVAVAAGVGALVLRSWWRERWSRARI